MSNSHDTDVKSVTFFNVRFFTRFSRLTLRKFPIYFISGRRHFPLKLVNPYASKAFGYIILYIIYLYINNIYTRARHAVPPNPYIIINVYYIYYTIIWIHTTYSTYLFHRTRIRRYSAVLCKFQS